MKKFFVLIAICAFIFQCGLANADVKKDAGYISLSTSKTKELEPDKAKISFAVETSASDAQKAVSENNEVSNKIINALKQVTSAETESIKTNNFSVRPNYNYSKGEKTIKNYTAVNSVTVDTKDIKKISKIIDTAIANGANRMNNLSYTYEDSSSVCKSLYPELMKDLRAQASSIAAASGSTLDGIKYLNASCNSDMNMTVSNGRFYAAKAAMDSEAAASASTTPVESGKVKVSVYVNADFYVK